MQTMRVLLIRDFRKFGPFAAGWLLLYFIQFVIVKPGLHQYPNTLLFGCIWISWAVLIAAIIRDARPSGSDEFWMTRPISGTRLFLSKLSAVMILCVLAPFMALILAKVLGLADNDWTHRANDSLSVLDYFSILLRAGLAFMLLAVLTRNSIQYIPSLFLSPLLMGIPPIPLGGKGKRVIMEYPEFFLEIMMALTIAGLLFLIHRQYTLRNRRITLLWSVAFVVTSVWLARHFQIS